MAHMTRLGDLERQVMERLWAASVPLTVRTIHAQLAADRELAYTTVMTVLDRLAKKGVVQRVRDGRAYLYEPVAAREQLVADLMHEALSGTDDRSAALVRFVDSASAEEAAAMRAALAKLEPPEGD
ncbi:MAG: BlaI/MecI/CopY family transcriptional regulator [Streptosporangiales bacterium]|nr:BlaI/MecI/CopY family transcriptional regulator [Streptosporangiales bacterium]